MARAANAEGPDLQHQRGSSDSVVVILLPSFRHLRQYGHGPAVGLMAGTGRLCLEGVILGTEKCKGEKPDLAFPLEAYK
jgi:hypothetical protein